MIICTVLNTFTKNILICTIVDTSSAPHGAQSSAPLMALFALLIARSSLSAPHSAPLAPQRSS